MVCCFIISGVNSTENHSILKIEGIAFHRRLGDKEIMMMMTTIITHRSVNHSDSGGILIMMMKSGDLVMFYF
jgi:hypothetical protein